MPRQAPLQVALPQDLEDFVAATVAEGRYASEGEVVRAGLRLLSQQDRSEAGGLESLRKRLQEGLDQALRGDLHDADEVFDALERRLAV